MMRPLLTKTLLRSTAVHAVFPLYLLGAHARSAFVAVYSDYIRVYAITPGGRLWIWLTKAGLGGSVIAANVAHLGRAYAQTAKPDSDGSAAGSTDLILVLTTSECLVLSFECAGPRLRVVCRSIPLPSSVDYLKAVGPFLAVDSHKRVLVFGAHEHALLLTSYDGCQRHILSFKGVLRAVDFLIAGPDKLDLVLLTVENDRLNLYRAQWSATGDLSSAQLRFQQSLDIDAADLDHIVSLADTAALLITAHDRVSIVTCPETGQGHFRPLLIPASKLESVIHTRSGPSWVACSKAQLGTLDDLILARADGYLCRLYWNDENNLLAPTAHTGSMEKHVSGVLTTIVMPDLTHLLACISDEGIDLYRYSLNHERTIELEKLDHHRTMSSINDIVSLPIESRRQGIYAVCGRQPYGTLSELRLGFGARLLPEWAVEGLDGCTHVHILPRPDRSDALLLFSFPVLPSTPATVVVSLSSQQVSELDDSAVSHRLDLLHPTLAVSSCAGYLCQVTSASINIISQASDVDSASLEANDGERSTCATIDAASSLLLIASETLNARSATSIVRLLTLPDLVDHHSLELQSAPTEMLLFENVRGRFAAIACADQSLEIFAVGNERQLLSIFSHTFASANDPSGICDSLVFLHPEAKMTAESSQIRLACGLRDGTLHMLVLDIDSSGRLQLSNDFPIFLGATTVKLALYKSPRGNSRRILATTDTAMYLITCSGDEGDDFPTFTQIWIYDPDDPSFDPGPISVLAQLPLLNADSQSDLDHAIIVIDNAACMLARLGDELTSVPRSVGVTGTPTRLLYSRHLSHFVIATSNSNDELVTRGRLEFHAADLSSVRPPFFPLQAGERVFALLDWVYRSEDHKKYVFILVATGIVDEQGKSKGRVHLIQPMLRKGKIEGCNLATTMRHDDAVTALALYGESQFVAGSQSSLALYTYSAGHKKWDLSSSIDVGSRVMQIVVEGDVLLVATAADATMRFSIVGGSSEFQLEGTEDGARPGLSVLVDSEAGAAMDDGLALALASTRQKQVRGLMVTRHVPTPLQCVVEAHLNHSLVRILRVESSSVPGTSRVQILGFSANGAITGLAALDPESWAVLSFVETLCRRSPRCPGYRQRQDVTPWTPRQVPPPLGLLGLKRYEAESEAEFEARSGCVQTHGGPQRICAGNPREAHVDADVLQWIWTGGAGLLSGLIEDETATMDVGDDDRTRAFLRRHRDRELELAVDAMRVVDQWVRNFERFDACLRET